jgi:hypothetical protein
MDDQLIGIILLFIGFAAPIASFRLSRAHSDPAGLIFTVFLGIFAVMVVLSGLSMASGK